MAEQGDQQDHRYRDPHAREGYGAPLLNARPAVLHYLGLLAQPNALLRPALRLDEP
jgi:hypothetical protein